MAIKIQVPKKAAFVRFLLNPWGRAFLILFVVINTVLLGTFAFYYTRYAKLIEKKLFAGPFANTSMLFAAPQVVMVGDTVELNEMASALRRSGYADAKGTARMGWYNVRPDALEIFPGPDSYFDDEEAVIKVKGGKISQIISLRDNSERTQYLLEPELITNLFDRTREKRRMVRFEDLPKNLVNAVTATEDKRFFQHSGFDPLRILKAAYIDFREQRRAQGASTLSMQLARGFWLTPEKTWQRKIAETMITLHLEQKLSKEKIFEYYANHVDLGRRGSFAIRGFGEAAQQYFGKDFRDLSIQECATLAGLIQRPSYTNPVKWPDRARNRRNVSLTLMRENGYIDDREYATAVESPLVVSKTGSESSDAPYFVDLVNDWLLDQFQNHDFQNSAYRVYTTLDIELQHDAAVAVREGIKEADELIRKRAKKGIPYREPQVALVAMDPATGAIKALIGGRDYGLSQLNRARANRQPGSVFKPFVYAAALNTGLEGGSGALTPATMLADEPTTFYYDDRTYAPSNFGDKFYGNVPMRMALAKSLNIPTVKLGESVGFKAVLDLAKRAGLSMDVRATPAIALGSADATPIEVASAYTMFPSRGVASKPQWVSLIRSNRGESVYEGKPDRKAVLDPRVDYLMVSLMQEVMRSGTAAGVRGRGFTLPAAGKTGTSRDGWFAGFTSKLVCVVWVGFDDGKDLNLEGSRSALPIWTEFMKRAHTHRAYKNVSEWDAPEGIVSVDVDPTTGQLATAGCPAARSEVFISGTQPVELCRIHGGGATQVAGWETTPAAPTKAAEDPSRPVRAARGAPASSNSVQIPASGGAGDVRPEEPKKPEEKKGFFGRIRDIFK
ncbi:MAG: PBP1A family penicillin-binding protein [Bryobacteraceae bacterium]|nr:PBP1A family penicillin-binding protein [Bryobacteraceae bacterium]